MAGDRLPLRSRGKRLAKRLMAAVTPPDRRPGVTIVVYHKVGSPVGGELNVPLPEFRRQMAWLAGRFPVLPLPDALRLAGAGALARDAVCLTFDDGYRHVLAHAAPVLRALGLPATVYVCPAYAARGGMLPWDRSASERVMDWAELRELTADGLFRCGSHTWSHRVLPGAPDAALDRELGTARQELEQQLGVPVPDFCYPKSLWDRRTAAAVRRCYDTAVVGGSRKAVPPLDLLCLPRVPVVLSDTFGLFQAKLAGRLPGEALLGWPRRMYYRLSGRWPAH